MVDRKLLAITTISVADRLLPKIIVLHNMKVRVAYYVRRLYIPFSSKEVPMQKSAHSVIRMNQRGISATMIDLVMSYGQPEGAKTCREMIEELKQTQKKLEHAIKKGGLTVVSCDDTAITAYRANSFSAPAARKIRG